MRPAPFLLVLVSLGAWAQGPAAAPSVSACVQASGEGQEHRKQGALFAARRAFEVCASPTCPQAVRGDCTRWLEELIAATPSLNVVVRVNGVDQPRAEVWLDGKPWLDRVAGRPQELEPGEHEVLVQVGVVRQTQKLIVVEGVKNRVVVFELVDPLGPTPVTTPAPVAAQELVAPKPVPAQAGRAFPVAPVVFSALAVAGGATFAGFGLGGRARLDALVAAPCAATKTCNPAETAAVSREFLAADLGLGVGVASALAAVGFWWWWAAQPVGDPPRLSLAPGLGAVHLVGSW